MDVRRFAALALTLPVLALGACTDEGSSKEPSPTPSSESPSPTVTSTGPSIPPEARGDDEASAKAFVRYYFEVMTEAVVTGNTTAMRQLDTMRCISCRNLARRLDEVYGKGGSYRTKGWVPDKFIRGSLVKDGHEFYLRVRNHPRTLFDGAKVVDRQPASVITLRVIVMRKSNTWKLVWLDVLR